MSNAADKIRELSNEAAGKKLREEQQKVSERINQDLAVIEKILAMVKDRLIYKEDREHGRARYIVVTEEIVLDDYANPPKYGSGTRIKQVESTFYNYNHTAITVNGHSYLHAADLITKYKFDATKAMQKSEQEYDAARDRVEYIKSLEALEPTIKALMLNYQKHLGNAEAT
jgi:hypothetical protein